MTGSVALSIGNFDGVHRGHLELLAAARGAVGPSGRVVALSFDPHPASILRPDAPVPPLTTFKTRQRLLREAGVDEVVALRPTPDLLGQTPEAFIASMVESYRPAFIVEGPDFRFGRKRQGSIETLRENEGEYGYRTIVIEPIEVAMTNQLLVRASSTVLRRLVAQGRMRDAAEILGRPYGLLGPVVPGDRRGRTIGVPTANLDHGELLLPADGVYAGRARRIDADGKAGRSYGAAISVGTKPTFGRSPRVCETHLVDFDGPLDDYGWTLELSITTWLREQVRYTDIDLLVEQLGRDIGRAGKLAGDPAGDPVGGAVGDPVGDSAGRSAGSSGVNAYVTNTTWAAIAGRLHAASRVALATHTRPDGDALGSMLALARTLPALGKTVDTFVCGPFEPSLQVVIGDTPIRRVETEPPGDDYDAIIVVDTGAWSQLEPISDWLRRHHDIVIGIDHHARGDDVAALRMVDSSAAAAAELVLDLLDEMGCDLTGPVAEALFVGVATDTGWFRYSNAGERTFRVAARLIALGVDKSSLYQLIEETHRPERLGLEARALTSVEYTRDGAAAIVSLRGSDFAETGCTAEDLTGVVNLPMIVGRVRVSVLLAEIEPGRTKMSFRAKPSNDGEPVNDVNELAARFGGGGHVFAAGATAAMSLDDAKQAVMEALA